ncbi:MAG: hypothetical protein HYX53_14820 [Chloroflexi bacterium]|nr:hypothetical protein [Chloroflexota bacterium]
MSTNDRVVDSRGLVEVIGVGWYLARTYDDRHHIFSTIVMGSVTENLDPESHGPYLQRGSSGRIGLEAW